MKTTRKNRTQQLRNFLKSDRAVLILCIALALIFWLLIKMSQPYRTSFDYHIDFIYPKGKIFVEKPADQLTVTIEGGGWDLIGNYFFSPTNSIHFHLADQATQTISRNQLVASIAQQLSSNIKIIDIDLDFVEVLLDDISEKKISIILKKEIQTAEGFQIKNIQLSQDSILLLGPASLVQQYDSWTTEALALQQLKTNQKLSVNFLPSENSQLQIVPPTIDVEIEVEEFTEKNFFVPVMLKNAPDKVTIFPDKIKVSCVMGLSQYNELESSDFALEVDFKNMSPQKENNTLPLTIVEQPEGIRNLILSPKSVEFYFVKEEK